LDSAANLIGPCPAESIACGAGIDPAFGAAFAGINPFYGQNAMLFPVGRSVYNGLQVSLKERVVNPMPGMKNLNLQVSYALSRFKTMAADQDFIELSFDQANATRYFGPASFDRTHQLAFGAVMEISRGPIVSFAAHFNTALPATPILEDQFRAGEIFHTDLTGDGTAGDIITGANIGSFGRDIKVADLNKVINSFNSNFAGKLTPAGQALVDAGLFTQSQLVSLGAVIDTVANAPAGQKGLGPLRALDFKLSWPLKIWESLRIEPGVSFYNIFNFANFDASPATRLDGTLSGQPGSINGTTSNDDRLRAGLGSGVFAAGAPRAIEFGLRLTF